MPVINRSQFDRIMLRRTKAKMKYAVLDSTTVDGTNPDLADPAATALRALGLSASDPTNPVDADFAAVADKQLAQLLDAGELATLEAIQGNLANPDQQADTNNEQYHGRLYDSLEKTIARKAAAYAKRYGAALPSAPGEVAGASPGAVGVFRMDISSDDGECWS